MVEGLRDLGVAVTVAWFEGTPLADVPVHDLGSLRPSQDRRYVQAIPELARVMRRVRPRVVHGVFVSSYGFMAAAAHRLAFGSRAVVPLIETALGTDLLVRTRRSRRRAALARFTLGRAAVVTGNSDALRQEAERLAPATTWHRFVWGPPRALLAADRNPAPIVLSNRRLEPAMRVERVVRAFTAAGHAFPDALEGWRLIVTNEGSSAPDVRRAAAGDPGVELVGTIDHAELHRLLLRSRVLVSIPESDSTSAALMDGLAAGALPVVGALPAPLEWVDEEVAEIVPADPTVEELAAGIARAATRDVRADIVRARVAGIVWEDELARLAALYRRLAAD